MPRTWRAAAALAGSLFAAIPARADGPVISGLHVTPLKTGQRAAVTWRTDVPSTGIVTYEPAGVTPGLAPPMGASEHLDAGSAHLVIIDGLQRGTAYRVSLTAVSAGGTATAAPVSFVTANATTAFDPDSGEYRANLLMRFDWDLSQDEMAAWEAHARSFAVRVADMSDGKLMLGDVILIDSTGHDLTWTEGCPVTCPAAADVQVFTGYGISAYPTPDRRVTLMWQQSPLGGIASSGSAIQFPRYVCCFGPTITDMTTASWTGHRLAHEFGHYGMWLVDQYDPPVCANGTYDISIMNNDFAFTEIDSADTPCAWQDANAGKNSWDNYFLVHYLDAGSRVGAPDPGPTTPGPWFRAITLNRGIA